MAIRIIIFAKREDTTLQKLLDLQKQGYRFVKWVNTETACDKCRQLDQKVWPISNFISNLRHNAPMFEHSHPECYCLLEVHDYKDGILEPVLIDNF